MINPKDIAIIVVGWAFVSCAAGAGWALTVGRALSAERERRRAANQRANDGLRALELADAYRRLERQPGPDGQTVDGEAWTFEGAASYWEAKANELGVFRRASPISEDEPTLPSRLPSRPRARD